MPASSSSKTTTPTLESPVVFSALPGEVAGEIEQRMAREGRALFSNTSTHRMTPDVPLMIPEVNPEHVAALEVQRRNRGWSGFIVTNPNCSAIHLVLALKPLHDAFGIDALAVTTMQAVSGAGYPGVPSLDMIDNVVPFINTEEEKMTEETKKLLGGFDGEFQPACITMSAHCNRVPVQRRPYRMRLDPLQHPGHASGRRSGDGRVPRQTAGDAATERSRAPGDRA